MDLEKDLIYNRLGEKIMKHKEAEDYRMLIIDINAIDIDELKSYFIVVEKQISLFKNLYSYVAEDLFIAYYNRKYKTFADLESDMISKKTIITEIPNLNAFITRFGRRIDRFLRYKKIKNTSKNDSPKTAYFIILNELEELLSKHIQSKNLTIK